MSDMRCGRFQRSKWVLRKSTAKVGRLELVVKPRNGWRPVRVASCSRSLVMLSWFRSPKGKTGELDEPARAPAHATTDTARTPSEQDDIFDDPITEDPELIQTPAVAGTPHDVALAGVNARLQQIDELNRGRKRQATVDTVSDGTSQFHSMAGDSAVDTPRHSAAFAEPAYDPFTGKHTGAYAPIEIGFEQTNDLIWAQLASIRDQQTELALLHERMERKHGEEKPVAVDDTAELEEDFFQSQGSAADGSRQKQEARMREQQFSQLAQRFQERKRDIDMVMGKVCAAPTVIYTCFLTMNLVCSCIHSPTL